MRKFAKLMALLLALVLVLSLAACKKEETKATEAKPAANDGANQGGNTPAVPADQGDNSAADAQIVGIYKIESISGLPAADAYLQMYGTEEAFMQEYGVDIQTAVSTATTELTEDFEVISMMNGEIDETGTWTSVGNTVYITLADTTMTGVLENGKLTFANDSGESMVMTKIG